MSERTAVHWRPRPLHRLDNNGLRDWLTDPGSLTARLQQHGVFTLRLLRQGLARPNPDEAALLGQSAGRLARIREVALYCDNRVLVFAHTALSRAPRGPLCRWLDRLGERSLGALLFAHPGFARGPLRSRRIDARHPLYARAIAALGLSAAPPTLWARRSCFTFDAQRVLVTEVFHPAIARLDPICTPNPKSPLDNRAKDV